MTTKVVDEGKDKLGNADGENTAGSAIP